LQVWPRRGFGRPSQFGCAPACSYDSSSTSAPRGPSQGSYAASVRRNCDRSNAGLATCWGPHRPRIGFGPQALVVPRQAAARDHPPDHWQRRHLLRRGWVWRPGHGANLARELERGDPNRRRNQVHHSHGTHLFDPELPRASKTPILNQLPAPGDTSQGDSANLALHLSVSLAVESPSVFLRYRGFFKLSGT
jgi:hypothetical protein